MAEQLNSSLQPFLDILETRQKCEHAWDGCCTQTDIQSTSIVSEALCSPPIPREGSQGELCETIELVGRSGKTEADMVRALFEAQEIRVSIFHKFEEYVLLNNFKTSNILERVFLKYLSSDEFDMYKHHCDRITSDFQIQSKHVNKVEVIFWDLSSFN